MIYILWLWCVVSSKMSLLHSIPICHQRKLQNIKECRNYTCCLVAFYLQFTNNNSMEFTLISPNLTVREPESIPRKPQGFLSLSYENVTKNPEKNTGFPPTAKENLRKTWGFPSFLWEKVSYPRKIQENQWFNLNGCPITPFQMLNFLQSMFCKMCQIIIKVLPFPRPCPSPPNLAGSLTRSQSWLKRSR